MKRRLVGKCRFENLSLLIFSLIAVWLAFTFLKKCFRIRKKPSGGNADRSEDDILEVLNERYARKEINKKEYNEKKKELGL